MIQNPKNKLFPVHPGTILFEEFMVPCNMTTAQLALKLNKPSWAVELLINGKVNVSPETAEKLSKIFNTTKLFWLGLQNSYEQKMFVQKNDDGHSFLEWIYAAGLSVENYTKDHYVLWLKNKSPEDYRYKTL